MLHNSIIADSIIKQAINPNDPSVFTGPKGEGLRSIAKRIKSFISKDISYVQAIKKVEAEAGIKLTNDELKFIDREFGL